MEDPDRKIYDWCGHLPVPRWVEATAYNNCKGCQTKMEGFLTKGNKHHCRLCGEMFCNACTAKYHVPLIFRIKNKDGPARVCMGCVEGCLAEKAKATAPKSDDIYSSLLVSSLNATQVTDSLVHMSRVLEIAPPPAWQPVEHFTACPKCGTGVKKVKSSHNCRVCGLVYCGECTSKMDVPASFERKKNKTGSAARVCDPCRFKIVSQGAKLVDQVSGASGTVDATQREVLAVTQQGVEARAKKEEEASKVESSRKRMSTVAAPTIMCLVPGCNTPALVDPRASLSTSHSSSSHSSSLAALSPPSSRPLCARHAGDLATQLDSLSTLVIWQSGMAPSFCTPNEHGVYAVTKLAVSSDQLTLRELDTLLRKTAPQPLAYHYVFRGEVIPETFYDVFRAKHLGRTLIIRPKSKKQAAALGKGAEGATNGAAAGGKPVEQDDEEEDDLIPSYNDDEEDEENNPFKFDPAREEAIRAERAKVHPAAAIRAAQQQQKEVEKPKPVFRKPDANKMAALATKVPKFVPRQTVHLRADGTKKAQATTTTPPPPPPPGSSPTSGAQSAALQQAVMQGAASAVAAGARVEDVFKQRAKQLFGQSAA